MPHRKHARFFAVGVFAASLFVAAALLASAAEPVWQACQTAAIEHGELKILFRDNSSSPRVLSGAASLFNVRHAPEFGAFDPDTPGASAGLNFEHIIAGHASPHNKFAPRHHPYTLERQDDRPVVRLVRRAEDDPWRVSSTLTYTLREPYYIDLDFHCRLHDPSLFGERGYAVFFFANYMNDINPIALNFLGRQQEGEAEHWIAAAAPPGHADYNSGGTYRHTAAPPLAYDADHNFKLNLWSYDWPRYTQPFYFGRAAHGMTLIMMFDKAYDEVDEIRMSLFKFKLRKFPRPALDWQYVIHRVEPGREYGFRARLVWKPFVDAADCQREYERWQAALAGPRHER
jgi:hypothetical protein